MYVESRVKESYENKLFRQYMADSLYYNARQQTLVNRYSEWLDVKTVDDRTGDEIAEDVVSRLGLKVV